jgi:RHS repeat-associated protein
LSQKFTGKERDNETGLDYFLARYYSSAQGRFTSVDPGNAGAYEADAQSWNGYAYARNNPLLYTDPDGEKYLICGPDGKNCYEHNDDDFYNARRTGRNEGYQFTGNGDFFEHGQIRDKDGNVIATYVQISIDDPTREFIFQMRRQTAPIPAATAAFFGISAVLGTGGGVLYYALGPTATVTTLGIGGAKATTVAAQRLRRLAGLARTEAREVLEKEGFKRKPPSGSYERWRHPDGSEVRIRPDGEVIRTGPKQWKSDGSGKFTPRYGPDGEKIPFQPGADTHSTGEMVH